MTLKDLRIAKGLSQVECAEYLGMSVRNYQNYESGKNKATTAKYNAIYQKLEAYGTDVVMPTASSISNDFHTNVVTGAGLQDLVRGVAKYQKRSFARSAQTVKCTDLPVNRSCNKSL